MKNIEFLKRYDEALEAIEDPEAKDSLSFVQLITWAQTIFDLMEEVQTEKEFTEDEKEYAFSIKLRAQKDIDKLIIDMLQD